ncbi:MAG TPA: rod shape-determining protein MreB, partial [Candidatus Latescibacteria bacterium]|nr:rod shape-determining protein MreB [Candidatus Latescibacterota bacterium]
KRAVRDAAEKAGAREVFLVAEPMAAAIGVGLPVNEPVGSMVIDIGGGTSEIAVISLSGVVTHVSERVGGDEMDEAIVQFMKKAHNLLIGERMAEQIKIRIGSAYPLEEELEMPVRGRDLIANIPKTVVVRSEEVREALQEPVNVIVNATRMALERTPPELSSDILDRGVIMTGGGSLLRGLDRRLREETGLPVSVMDDPLTCVAKGAGKILENIEEYSKVLF